MKYKVEFIAGGWRPGDTDTVLDYWAIREYLYLDPGPNYFYEYVMFPCVKKDSSLLRRILSVRVNIIYLHVSSTVNRDPNLENEALEIIKSAEIK